MKSVRIGKAKNLRRGREGKGKDGFRFYYCESNNQAELDFVIQLENTIIPIEVKSWESARSQSLEVFSKKYNIKNAIRVSAKNFGFENGIKSIPLYAVWCIDHSQPVF
ncbi:MAG: DUF4143 domain-containing protein, partial [Synergistaceae bacterium]|nr:DUF4143 domain-containing protein [Synergistaceae bacterium]